MTEFETRPMTDAELESCVGGMSWATAATVATKLLRPVGSATRARRAAPALATATPAAAETGGCANGRCGV